MGSVRIGTLPPGPPGEAAAVQLILVAVGMVLGAAVPVIWEPALESAAVGAAIPTGSRTERVLLVTVP